MDVSGRRQKCIHRVDRSADTLRASGNSSPAVRYSGVDREHSALKSRRNVVRKPSFKAVAPPSGCQSCNSASQLRQRDHTDKRPILIDLGEPIDYAGIWLRPRPFRYNIGIEKEGHSLISRGRSLLPPPERPVPPSGEAPKNPARLPLRLVLRSHSSADTSTAVVRPLPVIV